MDKIWIIFEREYLQRVKKKSFLLSTLITPLIFPLFIAITIFLLSNNDEEKHIISFVDSNALIEDTLEFNNNILVRSSLKLEELNNQINSGEIYGTLIIPKFDIYNPSNIKFYSKNVPSGDFINDVESILEDRIENIKIKELGLNQESLDKLVTKISLNTYSISDIGSEIEAVKSNSSLAFGVGYFNGFLIYMFVFIYGTFILQSVLDEKSSKVVEVIISSVKPFQLMMGKVLGVGAVAFTQILIWIILVFSISAFTSSYFGYDSTSSVNDIVSVQENSDQSKEIVFGMFDMLSSLDIKKIVISFIIYFLGGFFLYGAFFAAIGSAVDNLQDASQFTLPISLPIIASLMFMAVVLENPNSSTSVFLSMFPLTSPILMMARLTFGVPDWQLFLSIFLLFLSVLLSLWFAGRIYRVGILTSGSKVTYKLLWKWFVMKNY
jgi:ABC-2 type transport system permease protein